MARSLDLGCGWPISYFPVQAVYQRPSRAIFKKSWQSCPLLKLLRKLLMKLLILLELLRKLLFKLLTKLLLKLLIKLLTRLLAKLLTKLLIRPGGLCSGA